MQPALGSCDCLIGACAQDILATVEFELPAEDYKTLSNLDYQLKYFSGDGLAIGKDKPYSSYQELWDEEPTKKQIEFDYS